VEEWIFAQSDPSQQLAKVHHFSMTKCHGGGEIDVTITVKEFLTPKDPSMGFFAQASIETNRAMAAPYTPCGWGDSILAALAECVREVERFEP
jgi:hypothetical protein